jgi:hypothetical protein
MKKLLTIFGALTLSATPTAALTSVVSCAQPEVAHNYYGKSLVTKLITHNLHLLTEKLDKVN